METTRELERLTPETPEQLLQPTVVEAQSTELTDVQTSVRELLQKIETKLQIPEQGESVDTSVDNEATMALLNRMSAEQQFAIETLLASPQTINVLQKMANHIHNLHPKQVTLEGTPLYMADEWENDHEVGYNRILPLVRVILERQGINSSHAGLFDEYSLGKDHHQGKSNKASPEAVESRMDEMMQNSVLPFNTMDLESAMGEEAAAVYEMFNRYGLVEVNKSGNHVLKISGQPILKKPPQEGEENGQWSCPLLDALFQLCKETDVSILVHPVDFEGQQKDMWRVLTQICWLRKIDGLQNELSGHIDAFVRPQVSSERDQQMFATLQNSIATLLQNPPLSLGNSAAFKNQLLDAFKYFFQGEKKANRFVGVTNAVRNSLENILPFEIINLYFSENNTLSRLSTMDRSGKQSSANF